MSANVTRLQRCAPAYDASFASSVRAHLALLLASRQFDASARSRDFLCFVVEEALAGRGANLNQATIATGVFGRRSEFDPVLDPIVRVQAGRLRRSLERYYLLNAGGDSLRIELRKGGYAPLFIAPRESRRERLVVHGGLAPPAAYSPTVLIHALEVSSVLDDELAARLTDEVATELQRYGDVHVVRQRDMDRLDLGDRDCARFELRGRLHRDGEDLLVGARLVDRLSGEQVWSDEVHTSHAHGGWSAQADDIARVIAARIGAERGVIVRLLAGEQRVHWPAASGAPFAMLRSLRFFLSREPRELIPTLEAMRDLAGREPENPLAWMYLARLCLANHAFELSELETPIESAIASAYQAALLDPSSARIRCVLAASLLVKGELQAARDELDEALRLNKDALACREIIGWLTALAGDWERGVGLVRDAIARNPYFLPHARHALWADHMRRGEFEASYVAALEHHDANYFWRDLMSACSLGHLDRASEARAHAAELLRLKPQFARRGRILIGCFIKDPELRERVIAGLRKADVVLSD